MINDTIKSEITNLNYTNGQNIDIKAYRDEAVVDKSILDDINLVPKLNDNSLHKFYNFPKYYDKAFTRDVQSDISFFIKCFSEYSDIEIKRVLEPACGPGMFLEILPKYGFYALGYDINSAMVEYAQEKLSKSGLNVNQADVIEGNMKDMKFDEKFDAAYICINSLGYLRSEEDIYSHFKVMAESLKSGGLYIIEISCKCDDIKNEKKFDDKWYVNEENLDLELTWDVKWYDIVQRIRHVDFHMIINDNGHKIEIKEAHELRLWIFDEFTQFSKSAGFKILGIYNQNYEKIEDKTPITGELGALFFILKKIC